MPPPRILHIGQRKTGTTTLQKAGQDAAADGKIAFMHWELAELLDGKQPGTFNADDFEALGKRLGTVTDRPSLSSLELLVSLDPDEMARTTAAQWPDAKILITTRAPQSYLRSSLNNESFAGHRSLTNFARGFARAHMLPAFAFDRIVAAYEAHLGAGAVTLLPYELLCADRPRYLAALNDLFGFDIGAYFPKQMLNASPPAEFIALSRQLNALLTDHAPDVLKTKVWMTFKRMANFSAGAPNPELRAYFADYFAAHPIEMDPEPELPPETLEELAEGMQCLRDLPLYRPYLADYGLGDQG